MHAMTRWVVMCLVVVSVAGGILGCGGKEAQPPASAETSSSDQEQGRQEGLAEALSTQPAPQVAETVAAQEVTSEEAAPAPAAAPAAPAEATAVESTAEQSEVTATPQETEWIALCNGRDLSGWRNARDPSGDVTWSVEDGAMTNEEHGEDIATVQFFKDFDLRLEYKTVPGGNSGVYLRGRIEIQVLDSYNEPEVGPGSDGAVYGQFAPLVKASKPAGEWNTLEVTLVGNRLTAKLNGQVIHDNREITQVTGGALPGGVEDPGPLMLQGDHGKVWYRNIEIRPITNRTSE